MIHIFIYHDLSCIHIVLYILFVYVYLISQDMNLEQTQTPDDMLKLRPEIEELVADNGLIAVIASSEELVMSQLDGNFTLGKKFLAFAQKGRKIVPNVCLVPKLLEDCEEVLKNTVGEDGGN